MDETKAPPGAPARIPVLGPAAVALDFLGGRVLTILDHVGGVFFLLGQASRWVWRALRNRRVRLGRAAIATQIVRVGVRSVFIIAVVSGCVGLILTLQMAPPLDRWGQKEMVARIVGVAVFRELGPLIAAIVLTGFAGAAIAAEIGTMVVGEEIEALEAHALSPIRFLVIPRVIATAVSMTAIAVVADLVSVAASLGACVGALGISYTAFKSNILEQVKFVDFYTGVAKALIFGLLIGLIACANGLKVSGGASGVGRATTATVVECVVAIIVADMMFTALFYALNLV